MWSRHRTDLCYNRRLTLSRCPYHRRDVPAVKTTLGEWTEVDLCGHPCRCFEPAKRSPHGYVVIYLHSSQAEWLAEWPAILEVLAVRGLRVLCPMAGRSWWIDRVVPEFDGVLTPEKFVVDRVVALAEQALEAVPPRLALFGIGMGGQGGAPYRVPKSRRLSSRCGDCTIDRFSYSTA